MLSSLSCLLNKVSIWWAKVSVCTGSFKKKNSRRMASNSECKVRRKQWSDDNMISAMEAVKTGQMSVNVATIRFSVPRNTLDDRVKGQVQHGVNPGKSTVLTSNEEASLVNYLVHMAQCGFPLMRTVVKAYA